MTSNDDHFLGHHDQVIFTKIGHSFGVIVSFSQASQW